MAGITYEVEDKNIVEQIKNDAMNAAKELVEKAHLFSKVYSRFSSRWASTLQRNAANT